MAILRRLMEQRALSPNALFRTGADTLDYGGTFAGVAVTADTALNYSGIWACVRLIAGDIAMLPVSAYRQVDKARLELDPQPSWLETPDPLDPSTTIAAHFAEVAISLLLDGNAFILVTPSTFEPERLEVLNPRAIEVKRPDRTASPVYHLLDGRSGRPIHEFGPTEVVHIKLNPKPSSLRGMSPIDANSGSIGISLAAQKWVENWFGKGMMAPGFVTVPVGSEASVAEVRADIQKASGGWRKSGLLGFLTGGMTYNPTGITPKDADLRSIFNHQLEEGSRIFGIPPMMIGSQEPSGVAYASSVEREQHYVDHCLLHYLRPIELAYKRLVPGDNRLRVGGSNTYIRFNVNALLQGDPKARADFYQALWGLGSVNANTILAKEDMPPLPGKLGESYFVPMNMAALGPDGLPITPEPAATPAAPSNGDFQA